MNNLRRSRVRRNLCRRRKQLSLIKLSTKLSSIFSTIVIVRPSKFLMKLFWRDNTQIGTSSRDQEISRTGDIIIQKDHTNGSPRPINKTKAMSILLTFSALSSCWNNKQTILKWKQSILTTNNSLINCAKDIKFSLAQEMPSIILPKA